MDLQNGLVELTKVTSRSKAEIIVSMLKAYGIHAHAPVYNAPRTPFIPIHVPVSELEAARDLITEVMKDHDPDFAPPPSAASPRPARLPRDGEGLKGVLAALVAILIVILSSHLASLFWLDGAPENHPAGTLQNALTLSITALLGLTAARMLCDRLIGRYSEKTAFSGLALYGVITALIAFTSDGDLVPRALEATPSLAIIPIGYLLFWPHGTTRED